MQKATTKARNSPNACANDEGEDVSDEEGVEDIPGEEGGVAHHDAADAGAAAHSLARMTKPPFPEERFGFVLSQDTLMLMEVFS